MTAIETVSFWLACTIVISVISIVYVYRLECRLRNEMRKNDRYRAMMEAELKKKGLDKRLFITKFRMTCTQTLF